MVQAAMNVLSGPPFRAPALLQAPGLLLRAQWGVGRTGLLLGLPSGSNEEIPQGSGPEQQE